MITWQSPTEITEIEKPPAPDDVIPDRERERLDQEFDDWLDAGAFDPDNEINL